MIPAVWYLFGSGTLVLRYYSTFSAQADKCLIVIEIHYQSISGTLGCHTRLGHYNLSYIYDIYDICMIYIITYCTYSTHSTYSIYSTYYIQYLQYLQYIHHKQYKQYIQYIIGMAGRRNSGGARGLWRWRLKGGAFKVAPLKLSNRA